MSVRNPVAVTGVAATALMNGFQHIFRRKKIEPVLLKGDAFHRCERVADVRP